MSTDTLTSPSKTKTWLSFAIMFIAGLGGGVIAIMLLTPSSKPSRFSPSAIVTTGDNYTTPEHQAASSTESPELQELRLLREEVEQLRSATRTSIVNNTAAGDQVAPRPLPQQPTAVPQANVGRRTLAYWNGLNSIMSREAAMRAAPQQITAANAMSFVSGRTSAFEYAGSAIRQLNTKGVDPQAVSIGREIAAWYDQGIANSRNAESLLGSDDTASRQGSAGQGWSSSEKQHREACLAINRRGEQLRQELSTKYGLAFPVLQ